MSSDDPWPTQLAEMLAGQGPMPFRDFMAEALYAPKHGFHTRRDRARRSTRLTHDTVYVAGVARQLARMALEADHRPRLVLQGTGTAKLARFILLALDDTARSEVELHFVEPQLARRTRLVAVLQEFGVDGKVVGSPSSLGPGPTLMVAKEHLGAFPVHRVEATEAGWQEVNVTFASEAWRWSESLDDQPATVAGFLDDHGIGRDPGQRYEVNLGIAPWIDEVATILDPGRAVVIDRAVPTPAPSEGTLAALLDGEPVAPYQAPGEVDLSAAVDAAVLEAGVERVGLQVVSPLEGLVQALEPHLSAWVMASLDPRT